MSVESPIVTTAAPPEPPAERIGLSRTADGRAVPSAWARARSRMRLEDPLIGWSACIAVALLALFLRLWHLGTPHVFEFDETYYAKDAWSLLNFGYERDATEKANDLILDGTLLHGVYKDSPEMIVHPEVGKWLIAGGIKIFGMDPFGWRFASAIVGSLMVLVMCAVRPPDHRLDRARRGGGAAAVPGRAAVRAVAAGAARHLRRVLHPLRRCTASSPTATGTAGPPGPAHPGSGRPAAGGRCAACCSGPGCCSAGWRGGSRSAPSGRRSTRSRRSGCSAGSGRPAPAARSASGGHCRSRC